MVHCVSVLEYASIVHNIRIIRLWVYEHEVVSAEKNPCVKYTS